MFLLKLDFLKEMKNGRANELAGKKGEMASATLFLILAFFKHFDRLTLYFGFLVYYHC
jgi:hypothetical protein